MIMTAEQAFNVAMNEFPSLYTANTLELAKLKFYDQVFNVIGNGLNTANEFERKFTITDKNKYLIDTFPKKYITTAPLYAVGNNQQQWNHLSLYTREEAEDLQHMGYIICQCNRNSDVFVPYPNFSMEYSLVYTIDLKEYDPSWTIAAIYYYSAMEQWFKTDSVREYPNASHLRDIQSSIRSYEQAFKRYEGDATTADERNANITRAYGIPYTGDIEQFIHTRWDAELNRINTFIAETLNKLQQ